MHWSPPGRDKLILETACPGQVEIVVGRLYNKTLYAEFIYISNFSVPSSLEEIFSSGTLNTPTAGAFDIEPRVLGLGSPLQVGANSTNLLLLGIVEGIQYVLLDNKVEAVGGLILDTRVGSASIGFRNHSLPVVNTASWRWTEDIIFIEPITSCVGICRPSGCRVLIELDTNLTLNYTLENYGNTPGASPNFSTAFFEDRYGQPTIYS